MTRPGDSDRGGDAPDKSPRPGLPSPKTHDRLLDGLPRLGAWPTNDPESTKIQTSPSPVGTLKRDRPFLIVIGGVNVGEMYPLRQRDVIVGRASDAAVRFDDDGVSRRGIL